MFYTHIYIYAYLFDCLFFLCLDNYRLKNDEENSNPAVRACKVWRQTQSFQDVALSGLMDFLKFLNIPKHITYKHVFKNYLSPKFINKVKSVEKWAIGP